MRLNSKSAILVFLFICFSVSAMADSKAPTHCKSNEKVIFSCPFKDGKTVSLCASPDLSRDKGVLQYRFGRIGRKLEFSYPQNPKHPSTQFFYYPGESFGDSTKNWFYGPSRIVSFQVEKYLYSLEVFKNAPTGEFYGSVVVKREKNIGEGSAETLVSYTCSLDEAIDRIQDLDELEIPYRR